MEVFLRHAITIFNFCNTFYRGYEFGAGDDTGVFLNEKLTNKLSFLYLKTTIEKSLVGKYDFGYKLRTSSTHNFEFMISHLNEQPDYQSMSDFVKVIEKLVICDLIE